MRCGECGAYGWYTWFMYGVTFAKVTLSVL